jgi:hypothetical protein
MSIDGLRAWIGEVERKLRMRTRVFLALAVIAIGAAAAAIYLAEDTRNDAVSEGDVQSLQQQLEGQIQQAGTGAVGVPGSDVAGLEAEVKALQQQVKALQKEQGGGEAQPPGGGEGEK